MLSADQERLKDDILRAVHEAVDVEELGSRVLPLLDRFLHTSTSLLYRCNERGMIVPIAGAMSDSIPFYAEHYFSMDPLQDVLRGSNPWMLHGASMPTWKEYLSSPAYNECATRQGIDHFIHLRLKDCGMYDPGMVGIMVARTFGQPEFDERERLAVGSLLPALEVLVRRHERLADRLKAQPYVETLFELSQGPTVVMDPGGGFVWASDRAEALLGISRGGCKKTPQALATGARRMGALLNKRAPSRAPPTAVEIPREDGPPLRAELRVLRTRGGAPFIVAELEDLETTPRMAEVAARYRLTKTETRVLQLLSTGLTDREIGHRLFVSPSTVHSHVNHILRKLSVCSRIQAALIAHGQKPHREEVEGARD
jgi:DNA-binding CsgD family transcriptional regulator/PAS domain-containing protein